MIQKQWDWTLILAVIYLSIHLSIYLLYLSIYPSTYPSTYLSIYLHDLETTMGQLANRLMATCWLNSSDLTSAKNGRVWKKGTCTPKFIGESVNHQFTYSFCVHFVSNVDGEAWHRFQSSSVALWDASAYLCAGMPSDPKEGSEMVRDFGKDTWLRPSPTMAPEDAKKRAGHAIRGWYEVGLLILTSMEGKQAAFSSGSLFFLNIISYTLW